MKLCVYSPRPAPHEGRFAIVTNVGWQDAMDVLAQLTNAAGADGEIVRSRSPDAGIKLDEMIVRRRWLDKPGHRGDHV